MLLPFSTARILLLFLLAISLTVCSEKENDPDPDDTPLLIGLEGQVMGPAGVSATKSLEGDVIFSTGLQAEVPLPNVRVNLFLLSDLKTSGLGAQPIATTLTNSSGHFNAEGLTESDDLVAIVQTNPPLSGVFLGIDKQTRLTVNAASTLTAAYFGAALLSNASTVTRQNIIDFSERAANVLSSSSASDVLKILQALVPVQFGGGFPGNLHPMIQEVLNDLTNLPKTDCSNIVLSDNEGKPGDVIALSGLPAAFGDAPFLWMYDALKANSAEAIRYPVLVEITSPGVAEMVVPLHPENMMDGGKVVMVLVSEDETLTCAPQEFTIGPLSPAPGATKKSLDKFDAAIKNLVDILGFDADELLRTDPNQLDPVLRSLVFALDGLSGPDNDNNLQAILNGTASGLGDAFVDAEKLALLDAVLNSSGFLAQLDQISDTILSIKRPEGLEKSNPRGNQRIIRHSLDLHDDMALQAVYESIGSGPVGLAMDLSGIVVGVVGALVPATAPVATVMGVSMSIVQIMADMMAATLPSQLEGIDMEARPETYDEDDGTQGAWIADLVASSRAFHLNLPTVMGAIPGWGKIGKAVGHLARKNPALSDGLERSVNLMVDLMQKHYSFSAGSVFTIEAKEFKVPIVPKRYAELKTIEISLRTLTSEEGGDPFEFSQDEKAYTPREVGVSELRIKTKPGMFAGQSVLNARLLEVKPIEVKINESSFCLEEGESVIVEAEVFNALDDKVEWTASGDGIIIEDLGNKKLKVTARQPGNYFITAEATTIGGPRSVTPPPRKETAGIIVSDNILEISPSVACLTFGRTLQFETTVSEENCGKKSLQNITWTTTLGSISQSGMFTAPSQTGVAIVTAKRGDQTSSAMLRIGRQCDCWWIAEIVGPVGGYYTDAVSMINYSNESTTIGLQSETPGRISITTGVKALLGPGSVDNSFPLESVIGLISNNSHGFGSEETGFLTVKEFSPTTSSMGAAFNFKASIAGDIVFRIVNGSLVPAEQRLPGLLDAYVEGKFVWSNPPVNTSALCRPGYGK